MSRYRDQFIQLWHSELNRQTSKRGEAGNKLRIYRLLKFKFQLEGYLSQVKVAKYCTALTKLRVSCHRLQIEDEVHFLCVCPAYNNLREDLYAAIL